MPIVRREHIALPFSAPRYTPDKRTLAALLMEGGEQQAAGLRQQGAIGASLWTGLADALGQFRASRAQKQAAAQQIALRLAEREMNDKLQRDEMAQSATLRREEMAARAAEREAEAARRQQDEDQQAAVYASQATAPGRIDDLTAAVLSKFPGTRGLVKRGAMTLPESEGVGPLAEPETQYLGTDQQRRQMANDQRQSESAAALEREREGDRAARDLQFGETTRHNKAMEDAARRALDVRAPSKMTMPPQFADLVDAAMGSSIPAVRRKPIIERAQSIFDRGDQAAFADYLKRVAIDSEPVDDRRQVTGRMDAIAAIKDIRGALAELKAAGVDTNIARGGVEDLARKIGATTDPRLVALKTRIQDALFAYRRSLSGAAFTESEAKSYSELYPSYSNNLPVNEALLTGLETAMTVRDRSFWDRKFGAAGAAVLFPKSTNPASGKSDPMGIRQ